VPPPAPFLILHPLSELVSLYSARSMSCGRAIAVLAKFASTFQSTPGEDQTEAKKQKQCHHKSRGLCHPGRNGRTKLYNTENPTWPDSSPTLSRPPPCPASTTVFHRHYDLVNPLYSGCWSPSAYVNVLRAQ